MKAALQTALLVGFLGTILVLPAQPQSGGPGGAGGTYGGPGDTVPSNPGGGSPPPPPPPPPGTDGPADTGPGGGPNPGQPSSPGAANPGVPPPGMGPSIPPDEPTTPDAQPPVGDTSSWQLWWHYNRWASLPVGRARNLLASTGADDFFLGRGQKPQSAVMLRATRDEITTMVQPALLQTLRDGGRQELAIFSLHALAKLRGYDPNGTWNFDAAVAKYLRDNNQDVAEKALLALGIRGDARHFATLSSVLADNKQGRQALGRSRIGHRLRTFAVYGMALLAERNAAPALRAKMFRRLAFALEDERTEVEAAALLAIGFTAVPWPSAGDASIAPAGGADGTTRREQVQAALAFFRDRDRGVLARSQAPNALARLIDGDAPDALREEVARALLDAVGVRSSEQKEVKNGALIALGEIGNAGAAPLDIEIRHQLERVITGPGADRMSRYLALISLAQASRRPGVGDEPLGATAQTRRFLLRHFARSRGQTMAWTALALGLLEEAAEGRGHMPSADTAAALRHELKKGRSGDVVGAVAIALGMLRDVESQELLLARMKNAGSAPVRGYSALAIGMIGATDTLRPMRELLRRSANRPGTLQHVAIGLSLLGDIETGPVLSDLLVRASAPAVQASIAAAMGWVKDPLPLRELVQRLTNERANDISRAWTAVAVGRICDAEDLPWNALFSIGINYDVALSTLTDAESRGGLLDLP